MTSTFQLLITLHHTSKQDTLSRYKQWRPEKYKNYRNQGVQNMWPAVIYNLKNHLNIQTCEARCLAPENSKTDFCRAVGLRSMASRWCSISFREAWLSISFQSFWSFQCEPSKPPWGLEDVPCWTPAGATRQKAGAGNRSQKPQRNKVGGRAHKPSWSPWFIPPLRHQKKMVHRVCLPWSTSPISSAWWDSALGSLVAYWGAVPPASPWRAKPRIDRPTSLPHRLPDLAWKWREWSMGTPNKPSKLGLFHVVSQELHQRQGLSELKQHKAARSAIQNLAQGPEWQTMPLFWPEMFTKPSTISLR